MSFVPCNRHLLLKVMKDPEQKSTVLVPDEYKPQMAAHSGYKVVSVAADCSIDVSPEDVVIVDNSMVKQIKFDHNVYNVVLENYVLGSVK